MRRSDPRTLASIVAWSGLPVRSDIRDERVVHTFFLASEDPLQCRCEAGPIDLVAQLTQAKSADIDQSTFDRVVFAHVTPHLADPGPWGPPPGRNKTRPTGLTNVLLDKYTLDAYLSSRRPGRTTWDQGAGYKQQSHSPRDDRPCARYIMMISARHLPCNGDPAHRIAA